MSNVEVMYSVHFIKRTEQSETTLRHSAVRHWLFCGSLVLKSFKRSVTIFDVQFFHWSGQAEVSYEVFFALSNLKPDT